MKRLKDIIEPVFRKFGRNKEGSVAVEFSLLAVPFFVVFFAIFETGQILWSSAQIEFHTDRVARIAAVDGDYTNNQAQTAIQLALDGLTSGTLVIDVDRETGTGAAPDMMIVSVDYLYEPVTPFLLEDGFQISYSTRFPLIDNE